MLNDDFNRMHPATADTGTLHWHAVQVYYALNGTVALQNIYP